MARTRSAGDLNQRVAFDKREEVDRGDGVTVGAWKEHFIVSAGFLHLRGGEGVMASRLQGNHTQVIFVRASSLTKQVNTSWRIRDVRKDVIYNIRDFTATNDRQWIDFLCQSGVASG